MWVTSSIRSASVDFPWSMCATMQKFRMWEISVLTEPMVRAAGHAQPRDDAHLAAARCPDETAPSK